MSRPERMLRGAGAALSLAAGGSASALEPFTIATNWFAQAGHGGYYQALATGLYRQHGLDVTLRMGGPRVNSLLPPGAGQADCVLCASDLQMIQAREGDLPVVTVAAMFQKDPEVLIAHEGVRGFVDMSDRTILASAMARRGFWPWLTQQRRVPGTPATSATSATAAACAIS